MNTSPQHPRPAAALLHALARPWVLDADFFSPAVPASGPIAPREAAARARRLYREALREGLRAKGLRGLWKSQPDLPLEDLVRRIEEAEASPATSVVKEDKGIRVLRASLLDRDVLIKRYDLFRPLERFRYAFRPSRARRFWAAARTLTRLDIPTPEPLGYLEMRRGSCPVRSYVITAFIKEAAARTWIEPLFHTQPQAVRDGVRRDLLAFLLDLYRHGVYHGDTKTSNMLLVAPTDASRRAFLWIDLECARFGVVPTRHQIIRNLVQLNGSLGTHVPEEDRCAFLREMARTYPWVTHPGVVRKIRRWTAWRLDKERNLRCGP